MKKQHLSVISSLLLILSLLLVSCGGRAEPPSSVTKFTQDFKLAYMEAAKVYSAHVSLDAKQSNLVRNYTTVMENLRSEVRDELAIMQLCYTNTQEFFIAALTAAFGDQGIGGQDKETGALLNILALNETYPGDIGECQRAASNVAIYMRSHREQGVNIKGEIFRVKEETSKLELGDLRTAVIIDFYNKYGGDLQALIQGGDKAFADFVGSQSEDQKLPAKYFGFPTQALVADSRDPVICQGYLNIQNGTTPPPYGKYAYQYGVSWDTVSGICTLTQAAAEGYITMITTPSLTVERDLGTGCTSVIPGGCDENKPTDQP